MDIKRLVNRNRIGSEFWINSENKKNPFEAFDQSKNMPFQAVSSANNLF